MYFKMNYDIILQDSTQNTIPDCPEENGINQNDGDSLYNLGIKLSEQGRVEEAIACYRRAVEINPNDVDAHYNLGVALTGMEKLEEAVDCYRKVLTLNPSDAQAYNNLGISLKSLGKLEEAIFCYNKALEINPRHIQAHNNLGTAFHTQGKVDEALSCFLRVLKIRPNDAEVYNNMGLCLKDQGKSEEAGYCYRKAIEINPRHVQAYNNLGTMLQTEGKTNEAISCFLKAIELKPENSTSYFNLGNAFRNQGKTEDAISCYLKAVEITPNHPNAYFNMGNAFKDQGNTDEAISCYRMALEFDPSMFEAHSTIGFLLNEQGKTKESFSSYQRALRIRQDPGLEVRSSLLLPVICDSKESIKHYRKTLLENLERLSNKGIILEDPLKQVGAVNFLLAYHGLNDKDILEKIAAFYINACPELTWTAPHCGKERRLNSKIKIGIISTFLYSHTIGHLFHGIIKNLSRETFHITVFRFPGKEDTFSKAIDLSADEVVALPYELASARLKIAECMLDILFYLEIGMDPMTYFLAFSRLALVQCKRGHPVTSGIPNVDYFLSPGYAEIPEADDHYSERLVRLKTYGYHYYRPIVSKQQRSREHFNLPKNNKLYVCPQSLFKFHPDYDEVFGEILRKDPRGLLVLVEGRQLHWGKMLLKRFERSFSDSIDRVRILPRMPHDDFLALCTIADAVLDTPIFSGGKSSLDCFALGIPIVTLPGQFMRGRLTLAQYRLMVVMDCVAETKQDFVNIALRLANDKSWREKIRNKINSHSHVLFENMETVRELESFFQQAVKEAYV